MIRGLDGDRVVVLEDGQRTGDISSQSGDHGVPSQPRRGAKDGGGTRPGDAALRRQRHRRARQRDLRPDSHRAHHPAFRQLHLRLRQQRRPGGGGRRRARRQRPVGVSLRRQRPAHGRLLDAGGRSRELAVAHGDRQPRRRLDGRALLRRRQLRLHRHEVRHPHRRGGQHQPRPAPPLVQRSRRRHGPSRASSSRIAPPSASAATSTASSRATRSARRSTTTSSKARCCCRTGRRRAARQRRRLAAEPPVPGHRRRSARAAGGPEQRGGLPVRGGRHGRTPRCSSAAGWITPATPRTADCRIGTSPRARDPWACWSGPPPPTTTS